MARAASTIASGVSERRRAERRGLPSRDGGRGGGGSSGALTEPAYLTSGACSGTLVPVPNAVRDHRFDTAGRSPDDCSPKTLARPLRGPRRRVHGPARRDRGQRRCTEHPRKPGRLLDPAAVDRRRLPDGPRGRAVDRGRLGDLLGRRNTFLAGIAGFTLASAACGPPPAPASDRGPAVPGPRRCADDPAGFGLLREVFSAEELPKAFGFFGPVMGSAAMIGPILGGALVSGSLRRCLALGVPHQRADRARRGNCRGATAPSHLGPPRAHPRRCRRRARGGCVARPDLPADPGPGARLAGLDLRLARGEPRALRRVRACTSAVSAGRAATRSSSRVSSGTAATRPEPSC